MHDSLPPTDPVPPVPAPEAAPELPTPSVEEPIAELVTEALPEPVAEPVVETTDEPAADGVDTGEPAADGAAAVNVAAPEAVADAPAEAGTAQAKADLSPAATARKLAELFPALFAGGAKPLKLKIQADIQQRAPGAFSRKALSIFLHRHTTSTAYLRALAQQPTRLDLDGQPAGEIADEHRSAAAAELERRRGIVEAKRDAERRQQREAEGQARVAQAAQRRERAALLRAFETTTLTRPNFCALKGLSEAQLDEQLALARQEAAERARWLAEHPEQARQEGRPRPEGAPARREREPGRPGGRGGEPSGTPRPPRRDRGPRSEPR